MTEVSRHQKISEILANHIDVLFVQSQNTPELTPKCIEHVKNIKDELLHDDTILENAYSAHKYLKGIE